MGSIPNKCKHLLRTETSQKPLLKISATTIKSLARKVKDFQKLPEFNLPFNLVIVLNTINLSNSLHGKIP